MRLSRRDLSLLLLAAPLSAHAENLDASINEEIITIPAVIGGSQYQLQATLYRPNATGRFPLIVVNHGSNSIGNANTLRWRCLVGAHEFVKRGFAVVAPMRRGYYQSEGNLALSNSMDLTHYGLENARDIQASIVWLKTQSFVDPNRIVVVGQSTGGLATIAYLSMADAGVLGGIDFHGGVRPKNFIADPILEERIEAFAAYAKTTKLPSQWFYTDNDSDSRPPYIARLYAAYQQNGGHAQLVQPGPFGDNGHLLFMRSEGVPIWAPHVDRFLSSLKL